MKLSEAIRLGAMKRPQAFGVLFHRREGSTCAWGAALDAIGTLDKILVGMNEQQQQDLIRASFPDVHKWGMMMCPSCPTSWLTYRTALDTLIHLNDRHEWSRQRIADWVETIEARHEAPATPEAERALEAV